jgi:type VI secretion system protein ImpB
MPDLDPDLVAPIERIDIKVVPHTQGQPEGELPLNLLVLGDFKGRPDEVPLYPPDQAQAAQTSPPSRVEPTRRTVSVSQRTFDKVLHDMAVVAHVEIGGTTYPYKVEQITDFGPDAIVSKLPPLAKLAQLRQALESLLTPLKNPQGVRHLLEEAVRDPEKRTELLTAIGIDKE